MLKTGDPEVVCVAEFVALAGKEGELLRTFHGLMGPTHKEPGYIRYELNVHLEDPRVITFIEKFKSRAAFDEHCSTPYIKDFFDNVRPGLVESFRVNLYQEVLP